MIRPWHRCIGVSKAPQVEQPVVPAVRKAFSNNNKKTFDGIKFNVHLLIERLHSH